MGKITDYPSITNIGNDTILLGDGSSGTGKVAASELAQYALEEYAGSTVGGAAQSAKAALDNMSKGVIGYASGMNLDAMNTESVCGVYWINLEDSTLSGTKPGSSGQGMIFVKKQTENLFRQVYVPVTEGADYKSRYYSHSAGTWSAWAYTPMGTAINTVFGTTTIKTLTASDNLLTLAVGHYRINNAVPINAPDSSLKYGYVTIQNRGVNGYTYYEYAVGNGNGTSFKIYHGWKASGSATTIDWAEKKIYEDISALNSNMPVEVTTLTSAYGALTYKCYKIGKLVAVMAQLATDQEVPTASHAIEGLPYTNAVSNFTPITARNYTNGQVMTFSLRRQSNNRGALYVNEVIPSGASIRMNFVYANE